MKFKVEHFLKSDFSSRLAKYIDHDISLFVDAAPENQKELSAINIISMQEPNEYGCLHIWVIENKHLFDLILTWDDDVLNNCPQAIFQPFGCAWMMPEQYEKKHDKKFQIAHLCGRLYLTYGHSIRHELLVRQNEITIPKDVYDTYGNRYNLMEARLGKEKIFGSCQYGIAIENTSHNGYFTEKILDLLLLKTVPLYWGCPNIGDFFNMDGIIVCQDANDFISKINTLTPEDYASRREAIEDNYQRAIPYIDYPGNVVKQVIKFIENKICPSK